MGRKKSFSLRAFLVRAGAAACAGLMTSHAVAAPPGPNKPNIIVLVTDDQRWDAMGCAGNPIIQTPEMDRLAAEGCRFSTSLATTPICCASRASLLTGLYSTSHGIEDFSKPLTPEQWTHAYPEMLRKAGYHTALIGKTGLGGPEPREHFDTYLGYPGQGVYFPNPDQPDAHMTRLLGDELCGFVSNYTDERPFCMSVSFKAPHVEDANPLQFVYDPAYEDLYQDVIIPPADKGSPEWFEVLPPWMKTSENRVRWEKRFATEEMYQRSVKGYYRLVTGVDRVIGRLRKTLEAKGIADNTVILFTSDHGFYLGERGLAGKWLLQEESIRTPFILHDPRNPAAGHVRDEIVLNIDVAPTIMEIAGVTPPTFLQGRSVLPLARDEKPIWRDSCFLEHHFHWNSEHTIPASEGVRTATDKYIHYLKPEEGLEECYDLKADPLEHVNLAGSDHCAILREDWQTWKAQLATWKAAESYTWTDPVLASTKR